MAGELWTSQFIWHQYIRVTQFQSSAISSVFHILHLHYLVINIFHLFFTYLVINIFHILTNVIKVVKTGCYCFCLFHLQDLKPKQNHQIARSSSKSQTCVKYKGNIICIKRKTDVNKRDLKKLHRATFK